MAKVLLVDDVPQQLMAYRRLLRGFYDVVTADDGPSALELLERDRTIEVIVSDMCMPCMNGIEFFAQAARIVPGATRVMLTGNADLNATIDAINRGQVFRYLKKPCSRDELIEAIDAGLNLRPTPSIGVTPQAANGDDVAEPSSIKDRQEEAATLQLRDALQRHAIQAFYQPIVDLGTGRILGAEALARWQHPVDGWISPTVFVPLAEQCGLMPELGNAMLLAACQQAKGWQQLGFDGSVSVNASITQFAQGRLIDDVRDALDGSGLAPTKLCLELTETVLIDDPTSIIQTLEALRSLGITLAIDDFGTGYSSLAYLKYLPIDRLKIDRCFVTEIDRDERDLAFVRAMVDLAQKLNLTVVAEGIERPGQRDILSGLGCQLGQGFLFAKAVDARAFQDLLSAGPFVGVPPAVSKVS